MKLIQILKKFFIVSLATFFLILILDFFLGSYILKRLEPYISQTQFYERLIRIDHPVYHHTLKENINYPNSRGFDRYFTICTDNHGFRFECNKKRGNEFDFVFIGDSFTEGSSKNYEYTYAGLFEKETNLSVANMGIVSYAPYIYLSKLNFFLNKGYKFKHVVLFIDISDLYDDNVFYTIDKNLIVSEKYAIEKNLKIRKFLRNYFPFTNFYMFVIKNLDLNANKSFDRIEVKTNSLPTFLDKPNLKAKWTYAQSDQIEGFDGSILEAQKKMIKTVEEIYKLLNKNDIKLSIVVYPWPQQLQNDKINSKHATMWENFCINKCYKFINLFPILFNEVEKTDLLSVYKKYYWWGDVHFNLAGDKLVANELIKNFKQ